MLHVSCCTFVLLVAPDTIGIDPRRSQGHWPAWPFGKWPSSVLSCKLARAVVTCPSWWPTAGGAIGQTPDETRGFFAEASKEWKGLDAEARVHYKERARNIRAERAQADPLRQYLRSHSEPDREVQWMGKVHILSTSWSLWSWFDCYDVLCCPDLRTKTVLPSKNIGELPTQFLSLNLVPTDPFKRPCLTCDNPFCKVMSGSAWQYGDHCFPIAEAFLAEASRVDLAWRS